MRTATETKMIRVTALAVKVFWGITLVKLAIVVYLLITNEELRAYSTNMLGFYAMKPLMKETMDKVDFVADKTFEGLGPEMKYMKDATAEAGLSLLIMDRMMEKLETSNLHIIAPIAFFNAMYTFLPGMLEARKTCLVVAALHINSNLVSGIENDLTDVVDVLLVYMLGIVHSRIVTIAMTTLIVGASIYEIRTPFGNVNSFAEDFVSYVLDQAYLIEKTSIIENPIPLPALVFINATYILSIYVILITDILNNCYFRNIVDYLKSKFKPMPVPKDNRFEEFAAACSAGKGKGVIRSLLDDKSFNLNQRDLDSGNTGLHMACQTQNFNIVQALMDNRQARRINLNIENNDGKTPLMIAAGTGNRNIVRHLLKQPKLKLKGSNGDSAIVESVSSEHFSVALSIAEEIVKRGLCLRDCSKHLKDASLLETLRRCSSLERSGGKKMSQDTRKQSLKIYKNNILKSLREVARDGGTEEKLTQERVHEELKEFLECSICFEEYGEGPILACTNDHWICSACHPRNQCCRSFG